MKECGDDVVCLSYYFRVQDKMPAGYCLDRMLDDKAGQQGEEKLIDMYSSARF